METLTSEILIEALDFPEGPERESYLRDRCGGDPGLIGRYRSQLREIEENGAGLPGFTSRSLILPAGAAVGPYRIVEKVGEGGFGLVYRAEQDSPVRRVAALKVLRPGIDTLDVMRRFEQERQVLADLEHPGIARFYDSGSTPEGRPWFAMEFIDGVSIVRFCERERLDLAERLEVFRQACTAIQYAHLRGVIHRDLKPSNLLVRRSTEGAVEVKVIDFGVSRALSGNEAEARTLLTLVGQLVGTPAYMSPEQAGGNLSAVDTRTDIYALGAILYELLAGTPVISRDDISRLGVSGIQHFIRDHLPERPSRRLESLDAGNAGPIVARQLRGDLDWIVMKALEKEPERRYSSVADLSEDLHAFLEKRPVSARPPSRRYLASRFVQRHRTAVAAGIMLLAGLIAVTGFSTRLYLRERDARIIADREVLKSGEVVRFLSETLAAAGPEVAKGRDSALLREILRQTADRIDAELTNQPHTEAVLRRIVGLTLQSINERSEGYEQVRRAVEIHRRLQPEAHEELCQSVTALADATIRLGKFKEGAATAKEAERMWTELAGPDDARSVSCRCLYLYSQSKVDPRAPGLEAVAVDLQKRWRETPGAAELREAPNAVATFFARTGRSDLAVSTYFEEIAFLKSGGNPPSPKLVVALDNCGYFLTGLGRDAEAEPLLREALALGDRIFEGKSPHADHVWAALSRIEARRGNIDKQLECARAAARSSELAYSRDHPYWREGHAALGNTLLDLSDQFLEKAWQAREDSIEADEHRDRAAALLSELRETENLQRFRKEHERWIEALESLVDEQRESGQMVALFEAALGASSSNASRSGRIGAWMKLLER